MNTALVALHQPLPLEFYLATIGVACLVAAVVFLIAGIVEYAVKLPQALDDFTERWKLWRAVCRTVRGPRL